MQEFFNLIIIALTQGLLEYLPVSSGLHVNLFLELLGIGFDRSLLFFLQLATFLTTAFYFRSVLIGNIIGIFSNSKASQLFFIKLVLATLPIVVAGFFFLKIKIHVGISLILGSILMVIAEYVFYKRSTFAADISLKNSFLIGVFQALSLFSGFSRSGSTISAALIIGISRKEAVRFSFLISLPASFLGLTYDFYKYKQEIIEGFNLQVACAFFTCLLFGCIAIKPCIRFLSNFRLTVFAFYRIILGISLLLVFVL
jgi:undecaprenyl-diphosphatase